MKKLFTSVTLVLFLISAAVAQNEDKPKRPDNIGVGDFDSFKNSAFDTHDASANLNEDTKKIDTEIKGYSGIINTISIPKLKEDLAALRRINQSQKEIRQQLASLDDKGKSLLSSAADVKPKLKAPAATNNTKKSIGALDATRKNLDGVSGLLTADAKLIIDELKARGEKVEVFD